MTSELAIHPASLDELKAAHRNVHDIWGKGRPIEEHVEIRINSPSHSRAQWYVGVADDRVVVSLGCYPMQFRLHGRQIPGIAIGSVYTLSQYRGQGFAPRLLAWVENYEQQRGAALSILYCDIDPNYYARLGYALCPSYSGWRQLEPSAQALTSPYRLVPIQFDQNIESISSYYANYHGALPLSVSRDEDYWHAMLRKSPSDKFFELQDEKHSRIGYVRLGFQDQVARIMDFALADTSDAMAQGLYQSLIVLGAGLGAARVGGWIPGSNAARRCFQIEPRTTEITMIKALSDAAVFDGEVIACTDKFCEIDHV